jgi:acetyl-CoA carboxylase biotin carboxylase subunit
MTGGKMIKKLLIANRGEIAIRVQRTAREMGIATVAVYSTADRSAPHVLQADEAICLGPPPSIESYLRADAILEAAKRLHVDAIHPGYGFLAENADFAAACEKAGITFVGPSPLVIDAMGSKTQARQRMIAAQVPVVPGTEEAVSDPHEALATAKEIGFPVMVKAAAGGGGKGMRKIELESDFLSALDAARREAEGAFGDGSVYIEKYLEDPHHIEVQILADTHGHVIHLGERECSIQRRHQKVVEESPSPFVTAELRDEICKIAVQAAQAVGYVNAGTIEFLVDKHRKAYFLEMNTRLQVEHPVTEMVTGLDLVREQLRVASGLPLSVSQEDVLVRGHAIECRICAEDPRENFLPDTGVVTLHRVPEGPGVRVDGGLCTGGEISMYYDPMISKLIVWAQHRDAAVSRMKRAIEDYCLHGITHNLEFCRWVMENDFFCKGDYTTHFIQDHFKAEMLDDLSEQSISAIEVAGLVERVRSDARPEPSQTARVHEESPWMWKHRS